MKHQRDRLHMTTSMTTVICFLRLVRLETLSVTDNRLEEIPVELCSLDTLVEINLTNNNLIRLPQQLYNLSRLSRLYLARNKLKVLPEVSTILD